MLFWAKGNGKTGRLRRIKCEMRELLSENGEWKAAGADIVSLILVATTALRSRGSRFWCQTRMLMGVSTRMRVFTVIG